jgi:hypothetical protein
LLQFMVFLVEQQPKFEIRVTLAINGMLLSGKICSRAEFLTSGDPMKTIVEAIERLPREDGETPLLEWSPGTPPTDINLIHLRDGRYFGTAGARPVPADEKGIYARCRISEVSAFHIGELRNLPSPPVVVEASV